MKAVVDSKIPFIHGLIEQLVDEVVYLSGSSICREDVRDADVLIVRTRTRCDAALLSGSAVRWVITATIGYDHLDTHWLEEAHIQWANCPGCNALSVRQYIHNALLVCSMREGGLTDEDAAQPALLAEAFAQFRLQHHTVGVVGVGHVGTAVADDLEAMGFRVLRCDPPRGLPVTLTEVAEEADIVSFHTNLTHAGDYPSYHLANRDFFAQLQRHPLFINSSRGEVVDEEALLEALDKGQVSDAIIDTWEHEPHINLQLLHRCLLGTPHVAGYSADGKATATRMTLQTLCQFLHRPFDFTITPPALPVGFAYGNVTAGALRLYDPRVDSARLKAHPDQFEQLRGDYPLRRE